MILFINHTYFLSCTDMFIFRVYETVCEAGSKTSQNMIQFLEWRVLCGILQSEGLAVSMTSFRSKLYYLSWCFRCVVQSVSYVWCFLYSALKNVNYKTTYECTKDANSWSETRMTLVEDLITIADTDGDFLNNLITGDETWCFFMTHSLHGRYVSGNPNYHLRHKNFIWIRVKVRLCWRFSLTLWDT